MLPRAEFNCPYKFIRISNTNAHNFILSDHFAGNSIYWMDYDDRIRLEITRDVASLAPNVKSGDFHIFTVCAVPPRYVRTKSSSERLSELKDIFRDFASSLTREDMENAHFTRAVHKILHAAFTNALS